MKTIRSNQVLTVPDDVKVEVKARKVTVTGGGKKLERNFRHLPVSINLIEGGKKLEVSLYFGLSKQIATLRSVTSHIDNMIVGVTQQYRYVMRMVNAHFPINAQIVSGGKGIEIRNFLGEKIVRSITMLGDTKITKGAQSKDELVLEGSDIDLTSRS